MKWKPQWVHALEELETYAKKRGWTWTDYGHADLIRKLMEENRQLLKEDHDDQADDEAGEAPVGTPEASSSEV